MPVRHDDAERCVDAVLAAVGRDVRLALPLGIGKAVTFANALYRRAEADPSLRLEIFTALTLERPRPSNELEKRLMAPMTERLFGDAPPLAYSTALARNALPSNVRISEFYFQPGLRLGQRRAQQDYISANYTHVARDAAARGVNVVAQLVAERDDAATSRFSLSSNPDITLDILPLLDQRGPYLMVAEINRRLPYFAGDAELPASRFDHVLDPPDGHYEPFAVPHEAVPPATYAAAAHASRLVKDGGTLQLGIGAFSDALTAVLLLRHRQAEAYRELLARLEPEQEAPVPGPFAQGIYGASEMLVPGFLELMAAGIVRRRVYGHPALQALANRGALEDGAAVSPALLDDLLATGLLSPRPNERDLTELQRHGVLHPDARLRDGALVAPSGERIPARLDDGKARRLIDESCLGSKVEGGIELHSGFFVGSRGFYQRLRELSAAAARRIAMTGIRFINELAGDEALKRLQRRDAVFVNQAMMVTLTGAAVSDGLDDGRVVSGVGGQYNFVAMAHELDGARSVIIVPATRTKGGRRSSNIVPSYGHITIPRHLRDIVVTEYGAADLRGRTDAECIKAMIGIADSAFQAELLERAKAQGKIESSYRIPETACHNTPERVTTALAPLCAAGHLPSYPLGTELTATEAVLVSALRRLSASASSRAGRVRIVLRALAASPKARHQPYLERMALTRPRGFRKRFQRRLVVLALNREASSTRF